MTSDKDKKAAEEYAPINLNKNSWGRGCCGCESNQESHQEAFLAGCAYKEQQARAEVIAEVREALLYDDLNPLTYAWIKDELDKLERGAE